MNNIPRKFTSKNYKLAHLTCNDSSFRTLIVLFTYLCTYLMKIWRNLLLIGYLGGAAIIGVSKALGRARVVKRRRWRAAVHVGLDGWAVAPHSSSGGSGRRRRIFRAADRRQRSVGQRRQRRLIIIIIIAIVDDEAVADRRLACRLVDGVHSRVGLQRSMMMLAIFGSAVVVGRCFCCTQLSIDKLRHVALQQLRVCHKKRIFGWDKLCRLRQIRCWIVEIYMHRLFVKTDSKHKSNKTESRAYANSNHTRFPVISMVISSNKD